MVDTYHVTYEYSAGNSINFLSNDLIINIRKPFTREIIQPDGGIYVHDPNVRQRVFTGSGVLSGANSNTIHDIENASIDYSGAYPRITVINWDGSTTETNIEVYIPDNGIHFRDLGRGWWRVSFEMREKTKGDT